MRPEVKERLIANLESGEFLQGFRRQHHLTTGCFCAVGLITEDYRREVCPNRDWTHYRSQTHDGVQFAAKDTYLDPVVAAWAGLDPMDDGVEIDMSKLTPETYERVTQSVPESDRPAFGSQNRRFMLYVLNDLGVPFPLLAQVVREAL